MVFLVLLSSGEIVYSKVFDAGETMDGAGYYRLLRYHVIPRLKQLNGGTLNGLTWTQDGAPPHRTNQNINYIDGQFGNRVFAWKSRTGAEWPPRSPDLNPLGKSSCHQLTHLS